MKTHFTSFSLSNRRKIMFLRNSFAIWTRLLKLNVCIRGNVLYFCCEPVAKSKLRLSDGPVVELEDTNGLGPFGASFEGSSPFWPTNFSRLAWKIFNYISEGVFGKKWVESLVTGFRNSFTGFRFLEHKS